MTTPSAGGLREPILNWLTSLKNDYDYSKVFLFDAQGLMKLSSSSEDRYVEKNTQLLISEALRTKKVILTDLYRTEDGKRIHMDIVVPLFITRGGHTQSVGGLLLCIDPGKFLYPLIRSWPSSTQTAETLLVRREDNEVVFLNELRHRKDAPLTHRVSSTEKRMPAAMAARGVEGLVEGPDYRGVPVIAVIRRVPDSSWVLIAKMDTDEIYAPIREHLWVVTFVVLLLISGAGSGVGFVWHNQRAQFYRRQYEMESTYRTIFENTGTAIATVEEDTTISLVNSEFEKLSGYSREEVEGKKSWTEFVAEDDLESIKETFDSDTMLPNPPPRNFEFRFVDRHGAIKNILIWAAIIPGTKTAVSSLLDITRRKTAEEALQMAHNELERRVMERTADLMKVNEELEVEIAERKAVEVALRKSEEQLRSLFLRLIKAQETERRLISMQLHDQLGQDLSLMKLQTRAVQKGLREDQGALGACCEEVLQSIDLVIENVRRLSRDISPSVLENLGLTAAFRWLINNFIKMYHVKTTIDIMNVDSLFLKDAQINFYRVLQESLTNVGKHAGASNVSVIIQRHDDRLFFSVEDDGKGFDTDVWDRSLTGKVHTGGLGLTIIQERVQMLGGSFTLWSRPGSGTRINITFPLQRMGG
jgi:PAS domain S-box-containing protein